MLQSGVMGWKVSRVYRVKEQGQDTILRDIHFNGELGGVIPCLVHPLVKHIGKFVTWYGGERRILQLFSCWIWPKNHLTPPQGRGDGVKSEPFSG